MQPALFNFSRALFTCAASFLLCAAVASTINAQIKIACIGEQTTHSLHRENDPEYPQMMGELLDKDFKIDASAQHPTGGGFLYGGGANYRIGSFGHPQGTILDHDLQNPRSIIRSEELKLAEQFAPNIVILGPFGDHEALSKISFDNLNIDLHNLIAKIKSFKSKPVIVLALPLPRGGKDEDVNYQRIRAVTEKTARELHLPVIDLWTAFLGKVEYFRDATHLTESGRRQLARVVAEFISKIRAGHRH